MDKVARRKNINVPRLREVPPQNEDDQELEIVDLGGKAETTEHRMKRIQETKVSFADFFTQCLDYDVLKTAFGIVFFMFSCTCVLTVIYLIVIYNMDAKNWTLYFPKAPYDATKSEL